MPKDDFIRIRVTKSMKAELLGIAEKLRQTSVSDVGLSDVGRKAIEEYLDRHRVSSSGVLRPETRQDILDTLKPTPKPKKSPHPPKL